MKKMRKRFHHRCLTRTIRDIKNENAKKTINTVNALEKPTARIKDVPTTEITFLYKKTIPLKTIGKTGSRGTKR